MTALSVPDAPATLSSVGGGGGGKISRLYWATHKTDTASVINDTDIHRDI